MHRRGSRGGAAGDAVKCRMCGQAVAVGPDGRCPLGHFVGVPHPSPQPPLSVAADGDAGAAPAPADHEAGPVAAPSEPSAQPAAAVTADATAAPVTEEDLTADLLVDFGEFGDLDDLGHGVVDAGETVDLLAELGGEFEAERATPRSAAPSVQAPVSSDEPLESELDGGFDDLIDWDASASALETALDTELAGPDTDATAAVPAGSDEGGDAEAETVEDEATLEAEDRRVARRKVLGILGGTVAATALLVGSVLVLPL